MTHSRRLPLAVFAAACVLVAVCVLRGEAASAVVDDQTPPGDFSAADDEGSGTDANPIPMAIEPAVTPPEPATYGEAWETYESNWAARCWVQPEYLLWFTKGMELPALVTTSPSNTPQDEAGVLGETGTTVLYGNEQIGHKARYGGRLTFGFWFDPDQNTGIEASGFGVSHDQNSGHFVAASGGDPILARPFYNVELNQEDSELVAFPNILAGQVSVTSTSELQSAALALRRSRLYDYGMRLDCLLGYRFFRLREGLQIEENLVSTNPGGLVQQGTTLDLFDRFNTQNDFHGAEIGFVHETDRGPWTLEVIGKLALGEMFEKVIIDGQTVVTTPDDPSVTTVGGLLALPTNIGTYTHGQFCVVPELNVNLHCWLTERLNVTFGYTGIYVSDVVRAADQIDGSVDPRQLPGFGQSPGSAVINRPAALIRTADFWVQGANFGLEYVW